MKKASIIVGLALFLFSQVAAAQANVSGDWTGGFWHEGNWVIVDVRFNRDETLNGTADIIFPSYSNSVSSRNVKLNRVIIDSSNVEFEIPFNAERIFFRGQVNDKTISGKYEYGAAGGDFGMTRIIETSAQALEKYYGAYRVSPERVISVFRSWSDPRAVWFIDYKTGHVGTLWAESEDNFITGSGRGISYPVTLKVSFVRDASGTIKSLKWKSATEPNLIAEKIQFKEESIIFQNGNVRLGGTLILPPSQGPHPIVIVTPGDFGTNRNQLRWWAHNFVSRGIAALIFDSRGAGASGGVGGSNTFSDLADDVLEAISVLKDRGDINPKQIGLFGFSNSAWIVSLAASRSTDVGFLILQSFSGVPPYQQETFRAETQLRLDKFPESTVKQGTDFMRLKFEAARTGEGWEEIAKIMERSRGSRWLAYTNPPRSLEGLQRFWKSTANYDPVPALERIKIPLLAYWGGKDSNVPAPKSIAIVRQAMTKARNKNFAIKLIPTGRHDLIEGESGSPSIGVRLKKFPDGFWKMQSDWLLRRLKVAK